VALPFLVKKIANPVREALTLAPTGPVVVVEGARLARTLDEATIAVERSVRGARRYRGNVAVAAAENLPFAARSLAAVVLCGFSDANVRAARELVMDRGRVVVVSPGPRTEHSRVLLCSGLTDLVQVVAGRSCITSGQVRHFQSE
jgi:hypothetical protein